MHTIRQFYIISSYEIPDLEQWTANNVAGTEDLPFLYKITRSAKVKKNAVVFHVKIRELFYELIKHTIYKDPCVWYIRCQQFRNRQESCKYRSKIKFLLGADLLKKWINPFLTSVIGKLSTHRWLPYITLASPRLEKRP